MQPSPWNTYVAQILYVQLHSFLYISVVTCKSKLHDIRISLHNTVYQTCISKKSKRNGLIHKTNRNSEHAIYNTK